MPSKIEQVENGSFYDLGLFQTIPANIGRWQMTIFYIARYSTGQGNEVQNFRPKFQMEQRNKFLMARSLVVSDLRSETKSSRFEPGC